MKGYCLFDNLEVNDPQKLEKYKAEVGPLVARYGGIYTMLGGNFKVVEGSWKPTYLVIIEFPTYQHALDWYHSTEYTDIKQLRLSAATSDGIIMEANACNCTYNN